MIDIKRAVDVPNFSGLYGWSYACSCCELHSTLSNMWEINGEPWICTECMDHMAEQLMVEEIWYQDP
jgi:hypothetical protein